jgi:tRNA(adenine34) deaminase
MQYIKAMQPPPSPQTDDYWMAQALEQAREAALLGEVPVGAIVVAGEELVSSAHNRKETRPQATAHAELLAIEEACRILGRWRLSGCTLYVTLEPCLMCVGAIVQARFDRVVYGAVDAKAGAIESVYQVFKDQKLNHHPVSVGGVMQPECAELLSQFFANLRTLKKKS